MDVKTDRSATPSHWECPRASSCTLAETVDQLIEEFEDFDAWEDRYQLIIELGDELPEMPSEAKTPANQVRGCQSTVWMVASAEPARDGPPVIEILADSDSQIVRGLIAILLRIYSGRPPAEILHCDIHCVFERLQLSKHLSGNRRNGLQAMIRRIQDLASQHA